MEVFKVVCAETVEGSCRLRGAMYPALWVRLSFVEPIVGKSRGGVGCEGLCHAKVGNLRFEEGMTSPSQPTPL